MTRLERKEHELKKAYDELNRACLSTVVSAIVDARWKVERLEAEVKEMRERAPRTLLEHLRDYPPEVKDGVYSALLRISLLSDAVNEACHLASDVLAEVGVRDFTLRAEVGEMARQSGKIAAFVTLPNRASLDDMIVDDGKFVDMCIKHADAHIKRKLKLKPNKR